MNDKKKYLDALVLRFKDMNENAYKRLTPEQGGIDVSKYVAGVNVIESYKKQKTEKKENNYLTTENLIDYYIERCEKFESKLSCNDKIPIYDE